MTHPRAFARLPLTLGLAAVLILAACAPTAPASPVPTNTAPSIPAASPTVELASGGLQLVEFFRFT